jgi:hypothetical protein
MDEQLPFSPDFYISIPGMRSRRNSGFTPKAAITLDPF